MRQCPDCGPVAVSHALERWSTEFDALIEIVARPIDLLWERGIRPIVVALRPGRLAPSLFNLLATLRLGRIVERADGRNTWRARVLWEEAERRGIAMREFRPFGLSREFFFATNSEGDTRVFDGLPRPRGADEAALHWMDNKGIILQRFEAAGIPVPRGGSARTEKEALEIFNELLGENELSGRGDGGGRAHARRGAVIVKPALGSRSRHTYMHITGEVALLHAFRKAKEISSCVIVEEEIPGFVFRITLVGGKIAGVMRREPPHVIGDGVRTVKQLVEEENKNPLRHGPIFHELTLGPEELATLKEQNLAPESVPKKGSMVILHPKVSRSFGASTTEIEDVHPENAAMFLKIAEVLNDPLVGVDFMIEDMARPWHAQKCGVIECNSLPFIDLHHYPYKGPTKNVASRVWDIAFS